MNLRNVVASWPMLRRLWRWLPGPLRIPVLVLAAAVWVWQRLRGQDPDGTAGGALPGGVPDAPPPVADDRRDPPATG